MEWYYLAIIYILVILALHTASDLFLRLPTPLTHTMPWASEYNGVHLYLLVHASLYGIVLGSILTLLSRSLLWHKARMPKIPWLLAVTSLALSHAFIDGTKHRYDNMLIPQTLLFAAGDQCLHFSVIAWLTLPRSTGANKLTSVSLVTAAAMVLALNMVIPSVEKLGPYSVSKGCSIITAPTRAGTLTWRSQASAKDRYIVLGALPKKLKVDNSSTLHISFDLATTYTGSAKLYIGILDGDNLSRRYWSTNVDIAPSINTSLPLSGFQSSPVANNPSDPYMVLALGQGVGAHQMKIHSIEIKTDNTTQTLFPQ